MSLEQYLHLVELESPPNESSTPRKWMVSQASSTVPGTGKADAWMVAGARFPLKPRKVRGMLYPAVCPAS